MGRDMGRGYCTRKSVIEERGENKHRIDFVQSHVDS